MLLLHNIPIMLQIRRPSTSLRGLVPALRGDLSLTRLAMDIIHIGRTAVQMHISVIRRPVVGIPQTGDTLPCQVGEFQVLPLRLEVIA